MTNTLYETDFVCWLGEQARLLRAGDLAALDIENLAEEIDAVSRSERRELSSRIEVLLLHLLKWKMQPEFRCANWTGTINEQRWRIDAVLDDSPSLRTQVAAAVVKAYPHAKRGAVYETRMDDHNFPAECPFSPEQVLDEGFLPE